jgi:hypothetical protein
MHELSWIQKYQTTAFVLFLSFLFISNSFWPFHTTCFVFVFFFKHFFPVQNLRPPLSTTCSPILNNLIRKCWSVNPGKRPEFSYVVSVLEKFDHCLKEGLPMIVHQELRIGSSLLDLLKLKGCIPANSSVPVSA